MLPFNHELRAVKYSWASGLFCLKDGFRENSLPLWKALIQPPRERTSPFTVFQVAWSNGQSSPSCPPGNVFLIFISTFILLFSSDGERIKFDVMQSTLGLLRSALNARKEDFKSTGFLLRFYGGACIPAVLFFFFLSGVCLTFLSVSSVGSHKLGWNFCFTRSHPVVSHDVKPRLLFSFHSLSTKMSGQS